MGEIGDTDYGVQVGIGILGKVATAVAGLVGSIVVARVVGPTGFGVFYISVAVANFLENPISGWATACKKRMTETGFDEEEALGSVLLILVVIVVGVTPASFFILGSLTTNPFIPIIVPILLGVNSMYRGLEIYLSGRANFSMSMWSNTVKTVTQSGGKIVLVVLGFGVWGILGGTILGLVAVIPILFYWIGVRPALPSHKSLLSIVSFAKWSIPAGFVSSALYQMDIILLGWLATASVASRYEIALRITIPAMFVSGAIGRGLVGRISNLSSRDEMWKEDMRNSLSYGGILAVPIFFGSLTLGEEIAVTVFSSQYSGTGVFVIGLALYRVITTQTGPFGAVIQGLDRPDISFRISFVAFVVNIVFGIGLWWVIGPVGIVIATVAVQSLKYLMNVYAARRLADLGFVITSPFLKQIGSGVVMGIVLWAMKMSFGVSHWITVFMYIAIGGVIYTTCVVSITPHLRTTARGIYADFRESYI